MGYDEFFLHYDVLLEDELEITQHRPLKNGVELIVFLEQCSDELFSEYVSKTHNLFADWINDAYHREKLSKIIRPILRRTELVKILKKELEKDKVREQELAREKVNKIVVPKGKKEIFRELSKVREKLFL